MALDVADELLDVVVRGLDLDERHQDRRQQGAADDRGLGADEDGSTEYIIKRCNELPAGSTVAIGTDWNLVDRLRQQHADKTIFCLNEHICPCVTMNRIDLPTLVGTLESLADGELPNVVSVDEETATWAKVALDRMLALA